MDTGSAHNIVDTKLENAKGGSAQLNLYRPTDYHYQLSNGLSS